MDGLTKAEVWAAMYESKNIVMGAAAEKMPSQQAFIESIIDCYEHCMVEQLGLITRGEGKE